MGDKQDEGQQSIQVSDLDAEEIEWAIAMVTTSLASIISGMDSAPSRLKTGTLFLINWQKHFAQSLKEMPKKPPGRSVRLAHAMMQMVYDGYHKDR